MTIEGVFTCVTALATLITCVISWASARAAWAQVKEMRKQYAEDNRANIEVEFLYLKRCFYGLRFVNQGKSAAQNVRIILETSFIDALPEKNFVELLRKQSGKSCIIGAGQHYDLFFGTSKILRCQQKPLIKGRVLYQSCGKDYATDIYIDMENYATLFSVVSDQEDLISEIKEGNCALKDIKTAIQQLNSSEYEEQK